MRKTKSGRRPAMVCCTLVALAVAGCGDSKPDPAAEAGDARRALVTFYRQANQGRSAEACALMTPAGQKQFRVFVASTKLSLSRASCAAAVSALVAQAIREFGGRFGPASFPRFTVHGDVALSVKNASRLPLRLAKTSSGWKVDSLSMAPLTRPGEIPAFDADKIAAAHVDLARYCLQSLKSTTTPASQRSYLHALETYIRYYREAPRKAVSPIAHKTMRQLLTDEASALDGCGLTDDANELDRVLRFG